MNRVSLLLYPLGINLIVALLSFSSFAANLSFTIGGFNVLGYTVGQYTFNIPVNQASQYGLLLLVISVVGVTVLSGISVKGLGLNSGAVFILSISILLITLWLSITIFSYSAFNQIPSPYGTLVYFLVSVVYAIGIVVNLSPAAA